MTRWLRRELVEASHGITRLDVWMGRKKQDGVKVFQDLSNIAPFPALEYLIYMIVITRRVPCQIASVS